jgi:type IV pilus assembly protein PilO
MDDLEKTRKRFITAAIVLVLINLGLLAYLLWPGTGYGSQAEQEADLQRQYNNLKTEVERWRSSDPARTRADLKRFYADDIPVRSSQISQQIEKLLQETGVSAQAIRSTYGSDAADKAPLPNVQRVKVETTVTGDYGKVARFINAMERDRLFFIIDKVSLSGQEAGTVTLQISFNTFLREET